MEEKSDKICSICNINKKGMIYSLVKPNLLTKRSTNFSSPTKVSWTVGLEIIPLMNSASLGLLLTASKWKSFKINLLNARIRKINGAIAISAKENCSPRK